MGNYTRIGSSVLDDWIDADLQRIATAAIPCSLAGILIGGYGRGEGTPLIQSDGSQAPFNDYDLVVVVDRLNGAVRQKFLALEKQLTRELSLPVDLCPYLFSHLRRCEFSLLNYEMKQGHKVVWGDENILDAMPGYPHGAIPLSEGSRLLLNRGKLLLDIQQRLTRPEPLSEEERIRFIKFIFKAWLALGDGALLAEGKYDISYSVKKERITETRSLPDRDIVVDGYLKAVALKEWGDFNALANFDITAELETVRAVFLRFFPWYRRQHHCREGSAPKNLVLNLKWNRRLSTSHPREQLYNTVADLLQGKPAMPVERFYELQRRFS